MLSVKNGELRWSIALLPMVLFCLCGMPRASHAFGAGIGATASEVAAGATAAYGAGLATSAADDDDDN